MARGSDVRLPVPERKEVRRTEQRVLLKQQYGSINILSIIHVECL
jgi:hypothetical protein